MFKEKNLIAIDREIRVINPFLTEQPIREYAILVELHSKAGFASDVKALHSLFGICSVGMFLASLNNCNLETKFYSHNIRDFTGACTTAVLGTYVALKVSRLLKRDRTGLTKLVVSITDDEANHFAKEISFETA